MIVPCGKCPACLENRRQDWAIRIMEQAKEFDFNYFITLTYDEKYHPRDNSVDKRTLQLFIKRLRKRLSQTIKYYAVGEYGTKTKRPHYHVIVFNLNPSDIHHVVDSWAQDGYSIGFITATPLTIRRAFYTAKYHVNKTCYPEGSTPPFHLMSKSLGLNYVVQNKKWHKKDINRNFYPDYQFKKRLPRYYQDRIYSKLQKKAINAINIKRDNKAPNDITEIRNRHFGVLAYEKRFKEKSNYNNQL